MRRKIFGFTLVELIVTITVIGILASIVIVSYNGWKKSTITTQVKSDLNGAASAMESARTFNNAYLGLIINSTTFKPSQGVTLSGGSSDGGQTYCIDAASTQDATIRYYIDSISGDVGAQAGTCATRLIPILIATPASISSINLSWTAVPGATSYTLQIASSSSFADASTIATQSGLTFTSTGLLASTTYYYRVGVTSSTGLWSATQFATTTITAPITPTVVANTAGATTTWQWNAADCPTGTTGRYQYRYTTSLGGDSGQVATASTSISQNTSGQGNTYTVAVQSQCYNANASSVWSGAGSAVYSRPIIAVPTNLVATTISSTSINVSWSASAGATSYTLQRGSNLSFTDATTIATQAGLVFTSSGLAQGIPYYYRVQATDANGTSNWSTTATATTTIGTPATPIVAANIVTTTTTWSWNTASCAAGTTARYQYDYTISPAGYDSGWTATAGTSVAFITATGGQTYTVTVQAQCYNTNTSSGWSGAGSASYYRPISGTLNYVGTIATGTGPSGFPVSADGTSVYTVNRGDNTISMFGRNPVGGTLTSIGTIATGGVWPSGISMSADSKSVYATNANSNTLSMYSRNIVSGTLASIGTIATGGYPDDIAISTNGASLYVTNNSGSDNTISMYSRNTSTGALTALSPAKIATGSTPYGITISTDGTSVYAINVGSNTISIYGRNTSTGALTSAGTIATGSFPQKITISTDGTSVYATNWNDNTISIYSRNTSTGALTSIGTIATGWYPLGIVISADGTSVYAINNGSYYISMYSRNTGTGVLTPIGTAGSVGQQFFSVAISADGTSVYATDLSNNTISMYSRNP